MERICLYLLELRVFSSMTGIALQLFDLIMDQKIKDAVAIRTSKTAVLNKLFIAGPAGRTYDLAGLFFLLSLSRNTSKAGQQLSKWEFSLKDRRIRAKIHFLCTLGTVIMFRADSIGNFRILDICFSYFTTLT